MAAQIEAEGYKRGYADAMAQVRELTERSLPSLDSQSERKKTPIKRAPRGEVRNALIEYITANPGKTSGEIVTALAPMKERAVRTALQRLHGKDYAIEKRASGWHLAARIV